MSAFCGALTFTKKWTAEDIAKAQQEDADLRDLYTAKLEGREKPHGAEVSGWSEAAKNYLHDWRRITILDNYVFEVL